MTVKTDSWHYKVWAWSHLARSSDASLKQKRTSLCPYFWRVMLALVWLPPLAFLFFAGKSFAIAIALLFRKCRLSEVSWSPFERIIVKSIRFPPAPITTVMGWIGWYILFKVGHFTYVHGPYYVISNIFLGIVAPTLLLSVLYTLVMIGVYYAFSVYEYFKLEKFNTESSLVLSYLKAAKEKVCPLITFKDADADLMRSS